MGDTNIVSLPWKLTSPLPNFADALVQHVLESSDTTHPDEIRVDAAELSAQRLAIFGKQEGAKPEVHANNLRRLLAYYAQLSFAITKLPLDVGISFPWHPVFASAVSSSLSLGGFPAVVPISLANLQYERLSVLYNIAAMYSAMGVQGSRNDAEGIKASIAAFQNAAGTLAHLLELLSLLPNDSPALDPCSPDLSRKSVESLRDLCLGQAQEAFWQKAVMDRLKNGTIAKLSAKVSEFYSDSLAEAMDARGAEGAWPLFSFPPDLINYLNIKKLHFAAAAQFRKSVDDLGANRYGDEIGRLNLAQSLVKKASEGPRKGVAESVLRDLKSLQTIVADNLVRALKDNHLIYLEAVTPTSSLSFISPASMVKPTAPLEIVSPLSCLHRSSPAGLGKPLFEALVPYEVYMAVKVYEDRKEVLLSEDIVGVKAELSAAATKTLQSLNLPGSIEAILQPIGLPPSLLQKAEEVRSEDGPARLRTMMQDVRKVANVNQKLLHEVHEILEQEEAEDSHHRAQYGTERWTRQPSNIANAHLRNRAETLAGTVEAARKSDGLVRAKFGEWEAQIQLLAGDEHTLAQSIPSLATPTPWGGSNDAQSSKLRDLRRALDELTDLQSIQSRTVEEAIFALSQDDARPAIMREGTLLASSSKDPSAKLELAQFEQVFDRELAKFSKFKKAMRESASRQEDLLDRIKSTNEAFIRARREDPTLKLREDALQSLDLAYSKYREIFTNLQEGLKFYSSFSLLLSQLRDGCKQWAYARTVDSRDVIASLAHALEGFKLATNSPGVYDPTKDGPIRFG